MKKMLLSLLFPIVGFSQVTFGPKISVAIIDYRANGQELFGLKPTFAPSIFLEYKSDEIAGEFELTYYHAKGSNVSATSVIPSAVFKFYPVFNFALKAGGYLNSYTIRLDSDFYYENVDLKKEINYSGTNGGILIGMECLAFKKIVIDVRVLFDITNSKDQTNNITFLGLGYRF